MGHDSNKHISMVTPCIKKFWESRPSMLLDPLYREQDGARQQQAYLNGHTMYKKVLGVQTQHAAGPAL
jgi:hypothetical protein